MSQSNVPESLKNTENAFLNFKMSPFLRKNISKKQREKTGTILSFQKTQSFMETTLPSCLCFAITFNREGIRRLTLPCALLLMSNGLPFTTILKCQLAERDCSAKHHN